MCYLLEPTAGSLLSCNPSLVETMSFSAGCPSCIPRQPPMLK